MFNRDDDDEINPAKNTCVSVSDVWCLSLAPVLLYQKTNVLELELYFLICNWRTVVGLTDLLWWNKAYEAVILVTS
jgi:hypothetical protein